MSSNHLILYCPLLLPPSIFPRIRVFSNESALHIRGLKCWSFSFSNSPSNEYSRLISFRMDQLDLLPAQGTLKSLLQHHTSKASIIRQSAIFIVQLSHPYMTTGKTIALIRRTFVGKVMSLLFNMPSKLVITFLPRSKHLIHGCSHHLQWFWSPKNKVCYCFHCFPIYCHAIQKFPCDIHESKDLTSLASASPGCLEQCRAHSRSSVCRRWHRCSARALWVVALGLSSCVWV